MTNMHIGSSAQVGWDGYAVRLNEAHWQWLSSRLTDATERAEVRRPEVDRLRLGLPTAYGDGGRGIAGHGGGLAAVWQPGARVRVVLGEGVLCRCILPCRDTATPLPQHRISHG